MKQRKLSHAADEEGLQIMLARRRLLGAGVLTVMAVALLPTIFYGHPSSDKPLQLLIRNLSKTVATPAAHRQTVVVYSGHTDSSGRASSVVSPQSTDGHSSSEQGHSSVHKTVHSSTIGSAHHLSQDDSVHGAVVKTSQAHRKPVAKQHKSTQNRASYERITV